MKIAFVFFSGTGNTKRCIEKMEECLSAFGEEAVLFDLEQNRDPEPMWNPSRRLLALQTR